MGVRSRPLDFFVAFLVFLLGIYGFFDPDYPEKYEWPVWAIMTFEDVYLILSGLAIMASLVIREKKKMVVASLIVEMFGWAFISTASAVIVLTSRWVPISIFADSGGPEVNIVWEIFWISLSIASFFRYHDMKKWYRGGDK